jgi:chromodomain-helicase-DNA-binding protein 1
MVLEYASECSAHALTCADVCPTVINQIDTSGTNLSNKKEAAKVEYSKDELGAILKFGAASIFQKTDADLAKLEEMDLDDVMNKAEAYETATAPTGTSLGGEDFANQFAHIQDVKNDMTSWDDIIPLEDRSKGMAEANRAEAQALEARRRGARSGAAGQYAGLDLDSDDGLGKKKGSRKTQAEMSQSLKEKDIRALIRGLQKFGDIRHRYDLVVKDAKLESKNRTIIMRTADDIMAACRNAIAEEAAAKAARAQTTDVSKEKHRAVMITFKSVANINAETTVGRVEELKVLHTGNRFSNRRVKTDARVALNQLDDDTTWVFPPAATIRNTTSWACEWNTKDDALLLVGIHRHGLGAWEQIQKDPDLPFANKFFLEEGKKSKDDKEAKSRGSRTPSAVHLVRRCEYLLKILRDLDTANKPAANENGHSADSDVTEDSPAASKKGKLAKGKGKATKKSRVDSPIVASGSGPPKKKSAAPPAKADGNESSYESMDEELCKGLLRPVKHELKALKKGTDHLVREQKVVVLKKSLTAVGDRIEEVVAAKQGSLVDKDRLRRHLWVFTTWFW